MLHASIDVSILLYVHTGTSLLFLQTLLWQLAMPWRAASVVLLVVKAGGALSGLNGLDMHACYLIDCQNEWWAGGRASGSQCGTRVQYSLCCLRLALPPPVPYFDGAIWHLICTL